MVLEWFLWASKYVTLGETCVKIPLALPKSVLTEYSKHTPISTCINNKFTENYGKTKQYIRCDTFCCYSHCLSTPWRLSTPWLFPQTIWDGFNNTHVEQPRNVADGWLLPKRKALLPPTKKPVKWACLAGKNYRSQLPLQVGEFMWLNSSQIWRCWSDFSKASLKSRG